jgi:hypothetical protein
MARVAIRSFADEALSMLDGHHVTYDWETDASLSSTIVETLAAVNETEPINMEPLFTVINPDALDQLFEPLCGSDRRNGDGRIEFLFDDHRIIVSASGEITIRPDSQDATQDNITDEATFHSALTRLMREAEANGVDVEGGWAYESESESGLGIEIHESG